MLLIAWMLLIFNLSAQTATESSDVSGGFSYKLASFFIKGFEDKTQEEQLEIIKKMSFPIRKTAHFCIFAGLSAVAFLNISFFEMRYFTKNVLAFCFSSLYAASDEYHQKFVLGRSCELRDWLIDTVGVLVGLLFCVVVVIIANKVKSKKGVKRKMRKKELVNENRFITEELLKERQSNSDLIAELQEKAQQINLLNNEIKELKELIATNNISDNVEIIIETEDGVVEEVSDEKENILNYGAVIIGKVVMSAAEYCGRMESDDEERLNAAIADIFERMESVKTEIFDIISSNNSEYTKRSLMEREYRSAVSFFDRTASRF